MEEFEITPFGFVRKLCSISGIWPLLTPSQRRIGVLFMSACLFLAYCVQLLRLLMEIMNDWSNIKKTKQFVILLDYAFLSRKCIFMFICKETFYLQLLYVVDVPAIAQANSFGFGDTIKQNSTIYIDNTNELIMELLNEDVKKSDIGLYTLPIFFLICHLIWIFVFCTVGQHLLDLSEAIFYKGYGIPWYLLSKKTQRLLYFIIARADKPNYVSIGQMFVASHEFFAGVSGFLLLPYNTKLLLKFIIRISPTIYSTAGYTMFLIKRKKIKELFEQIHSDCELRLLRDQEFERIIKMYADNIKQFILPLYAMYVWFTITLIIFLIEPFVTNKFLSTNNEREIYKYPVSIGYYEKFQSHFFIIFVALCNIPIVESVVSIVIWIAFLHFIQHSCAMFYVTGYMFEHAFVENEKNKFEINKNTKIYEMFVRVIKYHNKSIRYS
ncbi:hypothetical protein HZH68_000150 [Vespula germanica]|uniref:Odorant receptor n=1 Tax=Vespula germanica TaxID=30212 RepID=A0A834U5R2_VESGE|nr:hypothetical protein HZH68_000150 [Vespula germanica]